MPFLAGTAWGFFHRSRVPAAGFASASPNGRCVTVVTCQSFHGGTQSQAGLDNGRRRILNILQVGGRSLHSPFVLTGVFLMFALDLSHE